MRSDLLKWANRDSGIAMSKSPTLFVMQSITAIWGQGEEIRPGSQPNFEKKQMDFLHPSFLVGRAANLGDWPTIWEFRRRNTIRHGRTHK
jgi:hypothetical protein